MSTDAERDPQPLPMRLLTVILLVESVTVLAAAVLLAVEQFAAEPTSRSSSLALLGLTVVAFALSVALVLGVRGRRVWVRGATITWQVLQIAAAWVVLQGDMAPWIGWVLIALAVVAIGCVLHPSTQRALRERGTAG